MIQLFSAHHVPFIYSMQVNFVMFNRPGVAGAVLQSALLHQGSFCHVKVFASPFS